MSHARCARPQLYALVPADCARRRFRWLRVLLCCSIDRSDPHALSHPYCLRAGFFLHSLDGGNTWTNQTVKGIYVNCMTFSPSGKGWAT